MNISLLVAFLSPFLPYLLKLGHHSAEQAVAVASAKVGEKSGEAAWNKAKAIWGKLQPKIESKEAASEAVRDVAHNPANEDMQASLRVQLTKLLEQDEALSRAIEEIVKENAPDGTPGVQIVQNITGNRNQAIGQVSEGTVIYHN